MRAKILRLITFTLAVLSMTSISPSAYAQNANVVILSDVFHREVNGKFTDDSLGLSISPTGNLYEKVAKAPNESTWVIDPQLIEEILDMSDGYKVLPDQEGFYTDAAISFLAMLRTTIAANQIFALPYGSPNIAERKKISDIEFSQIQNISSLRLGRALDLPISAGLPDSFPESEKSVGAGARKAFDLLHKMLNKITAITADPEVAEVSLRSNALLNPDLSRKRIQYLSISLKGTVDRLEKRVKVLPGKYTLTSTNEKIPVTIVNQFSAPAEVILILHAENSRVVIDTAQRVTIPEKSRKQVLITAKAIANGKVRIEARLETITGARYGETSFLLFTISMIGPVITWVMIGAGILLLGASGIQIYRRAQRKVVS